MTLPENPRRLATFDDEAKAQVFRTLLLELYSAAEHAQVSQIAVQPGRRPATFEVWAPAHLVLRYLRVVLRAFQAGLKAHGLEALSRCAFLLYKIRSGDHRALENAADAVAEAVSLLKKAGCNEEWFEGAEG